MPDRVLFQELNDYEKAVHWYELALWRCRAIDYTALIKRPGHGFPICADVLLRKTRRLEQAYEHNERALSYAPDDPDILYNKQLLEEKLRL